MKQQYKYCRYKGYKLNVDQEIEGVLKTYTTIMHVGKTLGMMCRDRDDFVLDIKKTDVDCIWVIPTECPTYDFINVTYGDIIVKDVKPYFDKYNSTYVRHGEFASYNGEVFKSDSGVNHNYFFKLMTNDLNFQAKGFIMEEPGLFIKMVSTLNIDYAYQARTFCEVDGKEFQVIDSTIDFKLSLHPLHPPIRRDEILDAKNLISKSWIQVKDVSSIWTQTIPVYGFEKFKNSDQILK